MEHFSLCTNEQEQHKRCNVESKEQISRAPDWAPVSPDVFQEADEFSQFQDIGITWSFYKLWMILLIFALIFCSSLDKLFDYFSKFSNKIFSYSPPTPAFSFLNTSNKYFPGSSAVSKGRSTSSLLPSQVLTLHFLLNETFIEMENTTYVLRKEITPKYQ